MNITIIGGIFHNNSHRAASLQPTTETMLADGLERRGHDVTRLGPQDLSQGVLASMDQDTDLVHVHHPGRLTTVLSAVPTRTPIVYTPHRTNDPPKRVLAVGHRWMFRKANQVVALSPTEEEQVLQQWKVPQERVTVIPNGFDDRLFPESLRQAPTQGGQWRLLFVGQLIPPKQPGSVLEAMDCSELANVSVRFVSHNPSLQPELEAEVVRRGLEERVTFVGQRHGEALAKEYRDAHALVLPSCTLEALPSVITEAMFTGLPVIAGDVGGIRWQLGGTGTCVRNIDAGRLRRALIEMMANYEGATKSGNLGAERARRMFSMEEMIERHIELYRRLI